jgi:hypothetical protein
LKVRFCGVSAELLMRKSKPINWFKLIIRILAVLVLLCCLPFIAITSLVLRDIGGFIGVALGAYFAFSTLPLFGKITPDRLKRFTLVTGVVLWMAITPPLFFIMERRNPLILALLMFLILPTGVAGFYLLLSRILLYFAGKQGIVTTEQDTSKNALKDSSSVVPDSE